jgi:hypothetical protein
MTTPPGSASACSLAARFGLLLGCPLADQVADHHDAGRDRDPHGQRFTRWAAQLSDRGRDCETGADRALGFVLMRARPAEVGEHAVAHELGDMALKARHLAGHRVLVGADHLAHVFGIELGRQRG